MDFHISELQDLMTLTADPLTLRLLSEGVSRARSDLRLARANREVLRKQRILRARQQTRRAIQVRLPSVGWRNINDMRISTISLKTFLNRFLIPIVSVFLDKLSPILSIIMRIFSMA